MPDLEQWVNVTRDSKWFGDGLSDLERTTESVKITIQFQERARATGFLSVKPASGNCTYSATEIPRRNAIFTLPDFDKRQFQTDETGKFETEINVGSAGGNDFTVKVKDADGNELQSDVIKTRRKLYFQIIRMSDVTAPGAGDITAMKNEYWNTSKKIYLKMVEYASGQTIPARVNYDYNITANVNSLKTQARGVYDNSKVPNCFVAVMVNRIGGSGSETRSVPATIGASNHTLTTLKPLMDAVDPAVDYYVRIFWTKSGGARQRVDKAKCTRSGNNDIVIDTSGLAHGAGNISYTVKVVTNMVSGLSYGGSNFTVVGTRFVLSGSSYRSSYIMAVLVHEIGHKIGMVPGTQSDRVLDIQTATHYTGHGHSGNHCSHGVTASPLPDPLNLGDAGVTPDCTMFGNAGVNTSVYCVDCGKSLRKLDLRGSNNVGLRTQF